MAHHTCWYTYALMSRSIEKEGTVEFLYTSAIFILYLQNCEADPSKFLLYNQQYSMRIRIYRRNEKGKLTNQYLVRHVQQDTRVDNRQTNISFYIFT